MKAEEIYQEITKPFVDMNVPPILLALLEEMSEHAEKSNAKDEDKPHIALIAFKASLPILTATINASLDKADIVTINYRNQSFEITKETQYLKIISELF